MIRKVTGLLGFVLVTVVAVTIMTTHKAAAYTDCNVLGDPTNSGTADNACLTSGQDDANLTNLSSGMSSSSLASAFISDIRADASSKYPVNKTGADYIESHLEARGGTWTTNVDDSTLTVEGIPSADACINTAYDPSSNSVINISECTSGSALVMRQNGVIVYVIRILCGNPLGNLPGPATNHPPTGSFTSLVCNAAAETYTIKVTFDDPDGATSAELKDSPGKVWGPVSGTSATWTISTTTLTPGDFPVTLWVKDVGPGASDTYKQVASHAIANCVPQGSISAPNCYAVSLKLWDPNNPDDNINYYLAVNGTKDGPYTFGGQDAGTGTQTVSGLSGFDYWKQNEVTLYGVDNQTGAQTSLGTATTTGPCASLTCGTSSMAGNTYTAGEPISFWVSMTIHDSAPTPVTSGPSGAKFTSVQFENLNTSANYEAPAGTSLESDPISYTPQAAGTDNLSWTFGGGESNPPSVSCNTPNIQVVYKPYFTAVGGDVSAGQGFGSGCTDQDNDADITGENLDSGGGSPNYFGASSRQAAIATGQISQFATDTTNNIPNNLGGSTDGLTANQPSGLAFANTGKSGTTYGGSFLGASPPSWCVPDYAASVTGTDTTPPSTSSISGSYFSDLGQNTDDVYRIAASGGQPLAINGDITLQQGVHVTIVVTGGDVYLDGNVNYVNYTSLTEIPQFTLIVDGGDLYIDSSVNTLHGFYAAEPSSTTNGVIFTCSTGAGAPSTSYSTCNNALTVYGAVAAGEIVPGRTSGNVAKTSAVTDDPAEQFVFTPELWLGAMSNSDDSCSQDPTQSQCMFQSYTSLPPVL